MQIHREQSYEDLFDSYFLQLQIVYKFVVFFTEDAKNQKLRIFGFKDNKWPK